MGKYRWAYFIVLVILFGILSGHVKVYAAEEPELLRALLENGDGEVYEVKKDKTGDFATIQEGVEHVESGDTLLIYPGVYEENVVITDKTVNLIGIDRDECVIVADSQNYYHIPLTIGAGKVCNITVCAMAINNWENALSFNGTRCDVSGDAENSYERANKYSGYAVHVDQEYCAGRELSIENCRIISSGNQCVGIGCWPGHTFTLTGCELVSKGSGGCIYIHNIFSPIETEAARLVMKDCELKNFLCPYVMSVHSMGELSPLYLTFQQVRVSTVAYEGKDVYADDNMNTWYEVDQLWNPEIWDLLGSEGYYSSMDGELVHHYSNQEYRELISWMQGADLPMGEWPQLEEGITYLETGRDSDSPGTQAELDLEEKRTRHVIDIYNADQAERPDGWCGLSGIYLTDESYGNTLPEMNCPRQQTDPECYILPQSS